MNDKQSLLSGENEVTSDYSNLTAVRPSPLERCVLNEVLYFRSEDSFSEKSSSKEQSDFLNESHDFRDEWDTIANVFQNF